ncbi:CehA/McbA family metallohydrolase [Phytomonospora sp. NPDC050363]|uniref:CehA/McbA family metallohydrolase n=1 Tax=Phytomonospora sp. NPDC050363 TaxID=3155642 RepID=UPI0033D731BE
MPETDFPPPRLPGRGRAWYRGDCHVHSLLSSGGELTPARLATAARAVGLDFIAITEHGSAGTHGAWGGIAGDDLLVILGEEVTTETGHWLALGLRPGQVIDGDYGVRDDVIDGHVDEVHAVGGLCVVAHPHAPYPSGTFMYSFEAFDAVEVWNGPWGAELPWSADNEAALAEWGRGLAAGVHAGRWRPAVGNSDTHLEGQLGMPHNVVFAEELGAGAVLAAIRAGRTWIAESTAVELAFTVSTGEHTADIGEHLPTRGEEAVVRAAVGGVPSGNVGFHTERGKAHHAALPASGSGVVEWSVGAGETGFVRVEVRHPDGRMAALSNPVTLG